MPLYEYVCPECHARFEQLRPVSRMDDPASGPCGHGDGKRVLSTFAAMSRGESGEAVSVGGGGCSGCSGGACEGCAGGGP
jgi:putative FmdB family regulatory protein